MQRATITREYFDAQHFPEGVNSYLDGQLLKSTQVRWAVNAVCKGGVWQTRPGYKTALSVPLTPGTEFHTWWVTAGEPRLHPQFLTVFTPTGDSPYLVFGVSGSVWRAKINGNGSISPPKQVLGISFDKNVVQVAWVQAVRSSTPTPSGGKAAITPKKILIMQDGLSKAAYWDGTSSGHLNPQKSYTTDSTGNTIFKLGFNQTRIGRWMAWSGNRLWVSNGSQVFASDINDPLYFTEEIVLTSIPVFNFDGEVTAMIDRGTSGTSESSVFVFTANSVYILRSGVQNRIPFITDGTKTAGWIDVPDFQKKIFAGVGCVAGKSVIVHRGILHWYSQDGIVSFDGTGTVNSTQALPPMDTELAFSKARVSENRSITCAGGRDSYVFWSVPVGPVNSTNGRVYNRQTQVLDKNVLPLPVSQDGLQAWQGIWTGIAPVEWATAQTYNKIQTFALELSPDGIIRIWEAFQGNRSDNGKQIPWSIQTKTHPVTRTPFEQSVFRHMGVKLSQIRGNLSVEGFWKSTKGVPHKVLDTVVTATPGSILTPTPAFFPLKAETANYNFLKQVRRIISEDNRGGVGECNSAGVESPWSDDIDSAFELHLKFRGVGALLAYRIAVDMQADNTEGMVTDPETGLKILPGVGCPESIEGVLPNYTLADDPDSAAFTPIAPTFEEDDYTAPAS